MFQVSGLWVSDMQFSGWPLEDGARFSTLRMSIDRRAMPSGLTELEQLYMWSPAVSVVTISVPHFQTHTHFELHGQATPTHAVHEAWYIYV